MECKNHSSIIKAFKYIDKNYIKLLICGKGPLLNSLKKLVISNGVSSKVKFCGYRNDMNELYKMSNIFIHPSTREGLGIVSLEAMASALPIITSNVHGITDYSINNKTGYVVDPKNIKGYANAIKKLANSNSLRKIMGNRNQLLVNKFDIKYIKKTLYNIILRELS